MRRRGFGVRGLAVAVAALSMAAVLAGPALAGGDDGPPARTGIIHDDCDRFGTEEDGDSFLLKV